MFHTPILLDDASEALAVTSIIVGEEDSLDIPVLVDPPLALALTWSIIGEDEDWFNTPRLDAVPHEALALTFVIFGEEDILL